jgi:hypothetical protein
MLMYVNSFLCFIKSSVNLFINNGIQSKQLNSRYDARGFRQSASRPYRNAQTLERGRGITLFGPMRVGESEADKGIKEPDSRRFEGFAVQWTVKLERKLISVLSTGPGLAV